MLTNFTTVNPPEPKPLHERALAVLAPAIGRDPHAGSIAARLAQDAVVAIHGRDQELSSFLRELARGVLRESNVVERMERESNRERDGVLFTVAALPAGSR